jgi:hypothetical protein
MPYATNRRDGPGVYFEDDGADGAPVLLHDDASTRIIGRRRRRPVQVRGEPHRRSVQAMLVSIGGSGRLLR